MKIAVVVWLDSSLQNGQVDRHDFPKPETITSIGWLVDHNQKSHVTLAREDMNNGDYRGLVCIPKCCIEEMRFLDPESEYDGAAT